FFVLAQNVEGADGTHGFGCAIRPSAKRQVETSQAEKEILASKRQRRGHPFGVDFHAEDGQVGIDLAKPFCALQGCDRQASIAKIDDECAMIGAVAAHEQRTVMAQQESIHPAQAMAGGFAPRRRFDWLARFCTRMRLWLHQSYCPVAAL